jgi:hypothetical protein
VINGHTKPSGYVANKEPVTPKRQSVRNSDALLVEVAEDVVHGRAKIVTSFER